MTFTSVCNIYFFILSIRFVRGVNYDGLVKSPLIPRRGRVRVEPFEFTSNGVGGVTLPRRVKRRLTTFYEVINYGFEH